MDRHELRLFHQRAYLQARHEKYETLDEVDEKIPEEDALQPRCRRNQSRSDPAYVKTTRYRGQHARAAQMLRHPESSVRRHQRQGNLYARIAHPLPRTQAQPTNRNAIQNFPDYDERK